MSNVTTGDILGTTGITKRQIDHWITQGYLRPVGREPGRGDLAGKRSPFLFHRDEILVALLIRRLALEGGLALVVAARVAREMVRDLRVSGLEVSKTTQFTAQIATGVYVHIGLDPRSLLHLNDALAEELQRIGGAVEELQAEVDRLRPTIDPG